MPRRQRMSGAQHVDDPLALPAGELAAAVARGDVTARRVVDASLARIESRAAGHAFISMSADRARKRAERLDASRGRPAASVDAGAGGRRAARRVPAATGGLRPLAGVPLAGVPLAVKDLFDVAALVTTAGSSFLDRTATRTAPVVRRLEEAGAVVVGKTNLHEFAWGVTSQNPHWGTVANPTLPGRVAGGSSGGSAAAVADRQATIAVGTDTGGSLRIPAACCGVVGYKPAFGSLPVAGVFPLAPSFDTPGPMARTVAEVALVDAVLSGRPMPSPRLAGLRVGVLAETGHEESLAALGARLEAIALPEPDADLMPVFDAECAITHLESFPRLRERYGADLQIKLDRAQHVPAVAYRRGLLALRELRRRAAVEPAVDLVISPVLPIEAPPDDCWEPNVRGAMTRFTRPFNFLGWPAIAIGNLQIAGRDPEVVLGAALAWEAAGGQPLPAGPA